MKFRDPFFLDQRITHRLAALQKNAAFAHLAPGQTSLPERLPNMRVAGVLEYLDNIPVRAVDQPIQIDLLSRRAITCNLAVRAEIDYVENLAIHRGKCCRKVGPAAGVCK